MDFYQACRLGDAALVERFLEDDPALSTQPSGPRDLAPILTVCFSPEGDAQGLVRCAELLLAAGADANSFYVETDWPNSPQSALYGASGVLGNVALTRILLAAGARTQDGESIYHAAELAHLDCLEALREAGADFSSRQEPWGNTPLYFLLGHDPDGQPFAKARLGIEWLLRHGADPNVGSYAHGETALHAAARRHSAETVNLLLSHGADPERRAGSVRGVTDTSSAPLGHETSAISEASPVGEGRTAYAVAMRGGNFEAAKALESGGANTTLSLEDQLLAAVAGSDLVEARRLLEEGVGLAEDWPCLVTQASGQGKDKALRTAGELGLPLDRRGEMGATPLHHAAWNGRLEAVRVLLATSPPLELRDTIFDATPLGWACHGSLHCRRGEDYPEIVRALLQAGARRPEQTEGSPEVMSVLGCSENACGR